MPFLVQSSILLGCCEWTMCCCCSLSCSPPGPPGPFPPSCSPAWAALQDYVFPYLTSVFVEFHKVSVSPLFQLVQVFLQGSTPFQSIHFSIQFGITGKLCQGVFDPIIWITRGDIKSPGPSTDPWGSPLVTGCQLKRNCLLPHPGCCLSVSSHPTAQTPCPEQTHQFPQEAAVTKGENALGDHSILNHIKSPMCKKTGHCRFFWPFQLPIKQWVWQSRVWTIHSQPRCKHLCFGKHKVKLHCLCKSVHRWQWHSV